MNRRKQHTTNSLSTIFKQWFSCLFLLSCLTPALLCQEGLAVSSHSASQISFDYCLQNIVAQPRQGAILLSAPAAANSMSRELGLPMLPQHRQLVVLNDNNHKITIEHQKWDTLSLPSSGCQLPVMHYAGAKAKDVRLPLAGRDSLYYAADSMMGAPLVSIKPLGKMRGTSVAELSIAPVRYNPAQGTIAVCRKLRATVTATSTPHLTDPTGNPMLRALPILTPDNSKTYVNTLIQDTLPTGYLIVTTPRYSEALRPLIAWKRQEGYIVDVICFDNGTSNKTVKDSLQSRYDNPSANHPAPLFILVVGDMADIPLWTGLHNIEGLDNHRTDFYYAEFSGDMLPDAFVGRLSMHDTNELHNIVAKTVAYEKGLMADTTALRRSLIVAGKEETYPAPVATNGQVNYIKQLLISHDPAHDTLCYYNPSSADRRDEILEDLREGVALMSYTAHCNTKGWRDPRLNNTDINTSDIVDHSLFVAINNCCRSNDVAGECFGEMLLRKAVGGAVASIGATNETLWEEDYVWSTGPGTMTENPQPANSGNGAFDRLLHPHLQPIEEQAWTIGQMLLAGNGAVAASGSPFADFYWEIYLLLGDPSLMPHIGPLHEIELTCDSVQIGDTAMSLLGTPWTRVAATCGDTLMGLCTLGADGEGHIHFRQAVASDICITATRQFHKAKQVTFRLVDSIPPQGLETPSGRSLQIYPNPARDRLTVCGIASPAQLTIFDSRGQKRLEKNVTDQQTIDLGRQLPSGIYTLSITQPDNSKTYKKIVIRGL